ncbi:MAG: prenyltransferase, partial [Frankiales bacterium]
MLRDLPGVLTAEQLQQTVDSIAAVQHPTGALPWPDGHTDPWDHVECAMALTLGGRLAEARAAYAWMRRTQEHDGVWRMKYVGEDVLDASVDTNQCAYVAVGVWQWWTITRDRSLVDQMWPHVKRALDFVLDLQHPAGHLHWSRSPEGVTDPDALVTGSSSSYQALRCGLALADLLGEPQPEWELAAGLLQHSVVHHPEVFLDKSRFSMDWYYPV